MKCKIFPGYVQGSVEAPASKSFAQRAVLAAALAAGTTKIYHYQNSDDSWHALYNAVNLGAEVKQYGRTLEINGGNRARTSHFYAGESGLTSRILSAILMTVEGFSALSGSGSLATRPFDPIFRVYEQLGVDFSSSNGLLPLKIGNIKNLQDIVVDGALSSQFITGLLMALPRMHFKGKLKITNPTSIAYIEMTIELLNEFGVTWENIGENTFKLTPGSQYQSANYTIEGDWSGASFLIAAGLTTGNILIKNLQNHSKQADKALLQAIPQLYNFVDKDLIVTKKNYEGFVFDATDCPDLFPPLAAIAAFAQSPSKIKGISRLKHKESDRAKTLQEEFGKLWIRIDLEGDQMIVNPSKPTGGLVDARNDHRIAMALSILALNASEPVTISGVECVSKSYPMFFEDLKNLGVKVEF
jgi:3-phosphoshikimate 1-carboxyvinyltransferase